MRELVMDRSADLFDHNPCHLGRLVLLRRMLEAWKSESEIEGLS